MFLKNPPPFGGDGYISARLAFDEGFIEENEASLFQFTQVSAQVSISDLQKLTQVGEINFVAILEGYQGSHDTQAYRLVDYLIQLDHGSPFQADVQTKKIIPPPTRRAIQR
jgi:hypothetical protein